MVNRHCHVNTKKFIKPGRQNCRVSTVMGWSIQDRIINLLLWISFDFSFFSKKEVSCNFFMDLLYMK